MLLGIYKAKYIGMSVCGFETDKEYTIKIDKDRCSYTVEEVSSDEDSGGAYITYSSEISIRRNWILMEE